MRRNLTRDVRQRVQLVPPLVSDLDGLASHVLTASGGALLLGVFDERLRVARHDRVQDVEHVSAVRQATFRELAREEHQELRELLQIWP